MSGQQGDDPQYDTWQQAFMGHNLLSYAWKNRPSMNQLVPGYDPDESTVQKLMDYGSLPARLAAAPLLQGGEAFRQWMSGNQGPEVRQELLGSVLGLMGGGLVRATPGPASFGAWHGSRHLFEPEPGAPLGAFKPIEEVAGTGEGTQAFAYGHYVAGKRGTSESYMTAGGDERPQIKLDGKSYNNYRPDIVNNPDQFYGLGALQEHMGDYEKAISTLRTEARSLYQQAMGKHELPSYADQLTETQRANYAQDMKRENLEEAQQNLKAAKWIEGNHQRVEVTPPDPGHLYQIAVKPDTHELLDWDKPLSGQSPQVQQKFADMGIKEMRDANGNEMLGKDIYHAFGDPRYASRDLHDAGIPGVQFLDQGSRGISVSPFQTLEQQMADQPGWAVRTNSGGIHSHSYNTQAEAEAAAEAARTRNYVIFHHSNLKVIDRDGKHFGRLAPANETDPWSIVPQP